MDAHIRPDPLEATTANAGRGEFFCVDRRTVLVAADLGLSALATFVAMARGCGRPNRKGTWGADAVSVATGLRWGTARAELQRLIHEGLIERTNDAKPRTPGVYRIPPCAESAEDLCYLPNQFVDGTHMGERSPLRLLRESGSIDALRSAVLLYGEHDLPGCGGLNWRSGSNTSALRCNFEIEKRYSAGANTVLAFGSNSAAESTASWEMVERLGFPDRKKPSVTRFWSAIKLLRNLGLLVVVPHLVDAFDGELLHSVDPAAGEDIEMRIAAASAMAADAMLPPGMGEGLRRQGRLVAAVPAHMAKAECVGVMRLRYRPRTAMTSRWLAELNDSFDFWTNHYRAHTS